MVELSGPGSGSLMRLLSSCQELQSPGGLAESGGPTFKVVHPRAWQDGASW